LLQLLGADTLNTSIHIKNRKSDCEEYRVARSHCILAVDWAYRTRLRPKQKRANTPNLSQRILPITIARLYPLENARTSGLKGLILQVMERANLAMRRGLSEIEFAPDLCQHSRDNDQDRKMPSVKLCPALLSFRMLSKWLKPRQWYCNLYTVEKGP